MDLIDRQAVIDALENIDCSDGIGISALKCDVVEDVINAINTLPSAQPRMKGKWIKRSGTINCSICKHSNWSECFEDTVMSFNYCPNCGCFNGGDS